MTIKTKRIYDPVSISDGYRVLVDRLWPRGVRKEDAHIDHWMKELAPSTALRKWFDHDPEKWKPFISKYKGELKGSPSLEELTSLCGDHKVVTLLYAAKDEQHNHALVLKALLTA